MTEKIRCSFERNRELALQLFASLGFAQVSVRKLASHLGLSTAALYSHCSSKEDLLFEALEEHYENILTIVSRAYRNSLCPQQRLQQISRAVAELYQRAPWQFQLASREQHCLSNEHRKQIEQLRQRIGQHLLNLSTAPANPDATAQAAGLLALNLLEQLPLWLNQNHLSAHDHLPLTEHLIQGLLTQFNRLRGKPDIAEEPRYAELQRRSA